MDLIVLFFISEEKEIAQYIDRKNKKTSLSLINLMKNTNKEFTKMKIY